jgi:hypothetical protein
LVSSASIVIDCYSDDKRASRNQGPNTGWSRFRRHRHSSLRDVQRPAERQHDRERRLRLPQQHTRQRCCRTEEGQNDDDKRDQSRL